MPSVPRVRRCRAGTGPRAVGHAGQSTVEFALVLPVVLAFLLACVRVGLLARDTLLLAQAARAGARAAAVEADGSVAVWPVTARGYADERASLQKNR